MRTVTPWAWATVAAALVLSGCGGRTIVRDYHPNPAEPQAEFEVALLDPMLSGETFDYTNYILNDCRDKAIEEVIVKLDGDKLNGKLPAVVKTRLPAGRPLKLALWHQLRGYRQDFYCVDLKIFNLVPGKKYRLQVHNQTTPGSQPNGFGCLYELLEMDANGANARQIQGTVPPKMANCK